MRKRDVSSHRDDGSHTEASAVKAAAVATSAERAPDYYIYMNESARMKNPLLPLVGRIKESHSTSRIFFAALVVIHSSEAGRTTAFTE